MEGSTTPFPLRENTRYIIINLHVLLLLFNINWLIKIIVFFSQISCYKKKLVVHSEVQSRRPVIVYRVYIYIQWLITS